MTDVETRYPQVEKLVLVLVAAARHVRPYFHTHKVTVLTNFPLKQVFQKPKNIQKTHEVGP